MLRPIVFEISFDQAAYDTYAAWSAWAAASCIERNRDHLWMLDLEWPDTDDDDYGAVNLACNYCHTSGHDVWGDTAEFISVGTPDSDNFAEVVPGVALDLDVPVRHLARRAGRIPVKVTLWQESYYSYFYGSTEYDAGLTIEAIGPPEWEEE